MPAKYQMVTLNLFLFILLGTGILLFQFIYPKKTIHPLLLVILIAILPTISIWRQGVYQSGDFTLHIYRSVSFFQNLQEGNFFPKWAGMMNATYGYPLFVFIYPLPYYLISLFHGVGLSFILSMKLLLTFTFIGSGISMYFFTKNIANKHAALVASLFYLFSPFHLVDLHFRVDIGELLAFAILPLTFLFLVKLYKNRKITWLFLEAFTVALLILSHQAISLVTIPFLLFFILFLSHQKKNMKPVALCTGGIFLGVLLTTFYWLPILFLKQYTMDGLHPSSVYFDSITSYLYSPWRFGFLFQGPEGQLSFLLGYPQLVLACITIYLLFKKKVQKIEKKLLLFFFIQCILTFFLLLQISSPLWHLFPLLLNFQFTYRLSVFLSFFISIVSAVVLTFFSKQWLVYIFCVFTIVLTMLNWGNRTMLSDITDAYLIQRTPQSTFEGEGLGPATSKWSDKTHPWLRIPPKKSLEVLRGLGTVQEITHTNQNHLYKITALTSLSIKENTLYFPGWTVLENNKQIPINYQNKQYPGIIIFQLSSGKHTIEVIDKNQPVQIVASFISVLTMLGLIMLLFISKATNNSLQYFPMFVILPRKMQKKFFSR